MAAATIVHDTSEAVELCAALGLYLKPITRLTISVALPPLRTPGKSISNWEVMERLKAMVAHHQFSALRIAKSTMEFIRFEGEVENRALVRAVLARLDGKTIKLSGFADSLRVRAAEFKLDFPSRHDWDSFFRDAEDMNETLPGERPDTIHLEGLPCKWFAPRDAAAGGSERPSADLLRRAFERFGAVRNVDIPMLDPYREDTAGRAFHTFSFGGHLNFEAYVQYREYAGFIQAMGALRGMKLMHKGDDGKAVACNIKVSFDSTKHLSDASIKKRQLERQKLQELERQREEQKRREKEAEERQRAEERKQKELEEQERGRRREEKLRRRQQRQREREARRGQRRLERLQAEEQRRLHDKIRTEERKLLLAQRNLHAIRLVAELLSRAKAARERREERARRALQERELRRVEAEKARALGLQRRERALRERLLGLLLARAPDDAPDALLQPVLRLLRSVSAAARPAPRETREPREPREPRPGLLACIAPLNGAPRHPDPDPGPDPDEGPRQHEHAHARQDRADQDAREHQAREHQATAQEATAQEATAQEATAAGPPAEEEEEREEEREQEAAEQRQAREHSREHGREHGRAPRRRPGSREERRPHRKRARGDQPAASPRRDRGRQRSRERSRERADKRRRRRPARSRSRSRSPARPRSAWAR